MDELIAGATGHGAIVLAATYPRCYLDLNRELTDIDAELLSEAWPGPLAPTDKTRRGLGLIRRYVVPGVVVHARALTVAEVQGRIATVYHPYHEALDALVDEVRRATATVIHVNWHSMKSIGNAMTPDGPGASRPDFVVSDRDGASAGARVTAAVVDTLRELGYRVAVNDPYRGGTIVARVGAPGRGIHSVQVEINRALYLDEARVEKTAGWVQLARAVEAVAARLAALPPGPGRP